MITSTQIERRVQTPDEGYDWLYEQTTNVYTSEVVRSFTKSTILGIYDTPYPQCTQAEYEEWQATHPSHMEETYDEKVNRFIREKYDQAKVEAMTYNYFEAKDETSSMTEEERAEAIAYYKEYQEYRKECKQKARQDSYVSIQ